MSAETVVLIAENDASRIDAYLAGATEYSRSQLQKWLKSIGVAERKVGETECHNPARGYDSASCSGGRGAGSGSAKHSARDSI